MAAMIQNYIFDFYGTLFDIHTNEERPSLWRRMAALYAVYGCDYRPAEMMSAYQRAIQQEVTALQAASQQEDPEIDLRKVFVDLLVDCKDTHPTGLTIAGYHQQDWQKAAPELRTALESSDWCIETANLFRITSRLRGRSYPHTVQTLRTLKDQGYHLYLLSNAQAVFTNPEIDLSGIRPYMDALYLSSDYGVRKPHREFMEILLEQEGLRREECIMVGNDFTSDIPVAMASGMPSIFLNTDHHPRSYLQRNIRALRKTGYAPRVIEDGDIQHLITAAET